MQDYRLYSLNPAGHIQQVVELACSNDEQAVELSLSKHDGRAMELWQRSRFIRSFKAKAP
jgi:hypothetical protein